MQHGTESSVRVSLVIFISRCFFIFLTLTLALSHLLPPSIHPSIPSISWSLHSDCSPPGQLGGWLGGDPRYRLIDCPVVSMSSVGCVGGWKGCTDASLFYSKMFFYERQVSWLKQKKPSWVFTHYDLTNLISLIKRMASLRPRKVFMSVFPSFFSFFV